MTVKKVGNYFKRETSMSYSKLFEEKDGHKFNSKQMRQNGEVYEGNYGGCGILTQRDSKLPIRVGI